MSVPPLLVKGVWKRFGGVEALRGVELAVQKGELFGVIGPNGAGKTVLMNVISGIYPPDDGLVYIEGTDVTGLPPHVIARKGVARTFQIPKLFPDMTVLENVLVPLYSLHSELSKEEVKELSMRALKLVGLEEMAYVKGKNLSGGQKKLLEFARGIAAGAKIYLMDEPFAGVNPVLVQRMVEAMKSMVAMGATIIVVSHELGIISKTCRRVSVLDRGQKIAEGLIKEVALLPEVMRAYLGE